MAEQRILHHENTGIKTWSERTALTNSSVTMASMTGTGIPHSEKSNVNYGTENTAL